MNKLQSIHFIEQLTKTILAKITSEITKTKVLSLKLQIDMH
jgi:hypothetical protein